MALIIKRGDILNVGAGVIAHQCNCVSRGSAGLAKKLFSAYPNADTYKNPYSKREPGTVSLHRVRDGLLVANLYAQVRPGKPEYGVETHQQRMTWLTNCFTRMVCEADTLLGDHYPDYRIYMPWVIGAGLADGDDKAILDRLTDLSERFRDIYLLKNYDGIQSRWY